MDGTQHSTWTSWIILFCFCFFFFRKTNIRIIGLPKELPFSLYNPPTLSASLHNSSHFRAMENTKLSLPLFAALLLTNAIVVLANSNENSDMNNNSSVIENSCAITLYPQLCQSTIYSIVGTSNLLSLKDIVEVSLSVAVDAAKHNYKSINKLWMSLNDVSKRDKIALRDCVETTDRAIYELHKAVEDLREYPNKKSLTLYADDLKTFLSSAITNQVYIYIYIYN